MHAILCKRMDSAMIDLRDRVDTINRATARGKLLDGREFIIATSEERLMGHRLSSYEVIGNVPQRVVDIARASIR